MLKVEGNECNVPWTLINSNLWSRLLKNFDLDRIILAYCYCRTEPGLFGCTDFHALSGFDPFCNLSQFLICWAYPAWVGDSFKKTKAVLKLKLLILLSIFVVHTHTHTHIDTSGNIDDVRRALLCLSSSNQHKETFTKGREGLMKSRSKSTIARRTAGLLYQKQSFLVHKRFKGVISNQVQGKLNIKFPEKINTNYVTLVHFC